MSLLFRLLTLCFAVLFSVSAYARKIEPDWIEIVHVPLTLPHLDRAFDGYKIVQITDIHADFWMGRDRLQHIVQQINAQQADAIALTGDFVTQHPQQQVSTLRQLAQLQSRDGIFAVLGNHDQWTDPQFITDTLTRLGITVLHNQVSTLHRGSQQLHLAGVGDIWGNQAHLPQVLQQLPSQGSAILLAHEPDFADITAATDRFDLQLSGHSHGGQIYLPFYKRITPRFGTKYPIGQYQVGSLIQYTSRGVGMTRPHFRFNCRPEITVLTLHSREGADKQDALPLQ